MGLGARPAPPTAVRLARPRPAAEPYRGSYLTVTGGARAPLLGTASAVSDVRLDAELVLANVALAVEDVRAALSRAPLKAARVTDPTVTLPQALR